MWFYDKIHEVPFNYYLYTNCHYKYDIGIRVIYSLIVQKRIMTVIIIGARADDKVYDEDRNLLLHHLQ